VERGKVGRWCSRLCRVFSCDKGWEDSATMKYAQGLDSRTRRVEKSKRSSRVGPDPKCGGVFGSWADWRRRDWRFGRMPLRLKGMRISAGFPAPLSREKVLIYQPTTLRHLLPITRVGILPAIDSWSKYSPHSKLSFTSPITLEIQRQLT
jgi:hypothetical protein